MNQIAEWLQQHAGSRESVRYLNTLMQLVVAVVAAWYVAKQVLSRGNAAAALAV